MKHYFKYYNQITRLPSRENLFFNRIENLWNSLPNEVVTALSADTFKAAIDCWLSSNKT